MHDSSFSQRRRRLGWRPGFLAVRIGTIWGHVQSLRMITWMVVPFHGVRFPPLGIKPRMGSLSASLGCSECPYFDLSNRRDQGGGFGDFFSL